MQLAAKDEAVGDGVPRVDVWGGDVEVEVCGVVCGEVEVWHVDIFAISPDVDSSETSW